MTDITVRCGCGLYVRAVDVHPTQAVEIAKDFTTHPCKESTHR